MTHLDKKALEAAREQPGTNHDGIIRAYLSALSSAAVAEREPDSDRSFLLRNAVTRVSELEAENARLKARVAEALKAFDAIIERSNNDPLGTSKVNDMRRIAEDAARRVREGGKVDGCCV